MSRIPFRNTIGGGLSRRAAPLAGAALFSPAAADGVLKGQRLRIIGLGDPVFQAMQAHA